VITLKETREIKGSNKIKKVERYKKEEEKFRLVFCSCSLSCMLTSKPELGSGCSNLYTR
jgi:hypothetical protein